jgi:hypothetical protein
MTQVSKPLLGLLLATVLFFGLWIVALKPSSSTSAAQSGGLGQYQGAINAAHNAVNVANGAGAKSAGVSTAPVDHAPAAAASSATKTPTTSAAPAPKPVHVSTAAAKVRLGIVQAALRAHKVLLLLFYNPAGSDDVAVKQAMGSVSGDRGRIVKLAVPITELSRYTVITTNVPVTSSPTLVVVDRHQHATTIVGFADPFEISQRVDSALAVK